MSPRVTSQVQRAAPKDAMRMSNKFGVHGGYQGQGNIYVDGQQCPDFSWSPPRKQVVGMMKDPKSDHGSEEPPRYACNVDGLRCALKCPPELVAPAHEALEKKLGEGCEPQPARPLTPAPLYTHTHTPHSATSPRLVSAGLRSTPALDPGARGLPWLSHRGLPWLLQASCCARRTTCS